jgi:hypothetical protein
MIIPKKYARYQWFIIFGLSLGFFLLLVVVFVVPTFFSIKDKKEKTDILLLKNEIFRNKLTVLNDFVLSDLEEKYELTNVGILPNKNPNLVLAVFDDLLSKVDSGNIDLGNISYSPGEIKEAQTKMDNLLFSQSIKGKKENLNDFVNLIEKSFPLMTIRTIQGKYGADVAMTMGFTLYIYPEIKQIPSVDTPVAFFSEKELKVFDEIIPFANIFNSTSEATTSAVIEKSGKTNPFVE